MQLRELYTFYFKISGLTELNCITVSCLLYHKQPQVLDSAHKNSASQLVKNKITHVMLLLIYWANPFCTLQSQSHVILSDSAFNQCSCQPHELLLA